MQSGQGSGVGWGFGTEQKDTGLNPQRLMSIIQEFLSMTPYVPAPECPVSGFDGTWLLCAVESNY